MCSRINVFCQTLLFELEIHNKLLNELVIGAAYKRLLSNYQASIILAENGMTNEMKVVSRNMLEQVALIVAISKNKNVVDRFLKSDEIQRRRLLTNYTIWNIIPIRLKILM